MTKEKKKLWRSPVRSGYTVGKDGEPSVQRGKRITNYVLRYKQNCYNMPARRELTSLGLNLKTSSAGARWLEETLKKKHYGEEEQQGK